MYQFHSFHRSMTSVIGAWTLAPAGTGAAICGADRGARGQRLGTCGERWNVGTRLEHQTTPIAIAIALTLCASAFTLQL
jgi:hypothetical protein